MDIMISFFAREHFFIDKSSGRTLQRISSIIRGQQIAEYLGAKFNPKTGYEHDVCIYLKPLKIDKIKDGDYVDILDDSNVHARLGSLLDRLKKRSQVNVLAMTSVHKKWLEEQLPNKVIHIPHQHMNFERKRRTRKKVTTCGYIGATGPGHQELLNEMRDALKKIGVELIINVNFETREDVINFYESIDIQVAPMFSFHLSIPYYHEKKIVDAMSFGIPTVTEQRLGYKDVEEYYYHIKNLDELIVEVQRLQKEGWDAERLINKAEEYHITNIAKKYERLEHTHTS